MKKFLVLVAMVLSLSFFSLAQAETTAVLTGNRIVITGDAVAHSGNGFDIWAALGWVVGKNKVQVDSWCWYGTDIVIGDKANLVTADGKPIGAVLNAVIAGQPLCHPYLGCMVDRLYVNELTHGSIIIILAPNVEY